jgi:MoaA/NifB/PqqE/SkfB family radical SAM enzyme
MLKNEWLFQEIEIETINRCNGKCEFCPVNVNQPQRLYAKMTDELFYKIIHELQTLKFSGKISLFSNNEPFLDERIIDFCKYTREKLPQVYINLFTNGSLMSIDKFKNIVPFLDNMVIDNYNLDGNSINNSLKEVHEYLTQHPELQSKVHFLIIQQTAVRLSRGGQAPNKKDVCGIDEVCVLPYRQMIIRPTGEVSLCCNDALGKYTLGDVSKDSIYSVWYSDKYMEIRKEMLENHRRNLLLCNKCDMSTSTYKLTKR